MQAVFEMGHNILCLAIGGTSRDKDKNTLKGIIWQNYRGYLSKSQVSFLP
jgi:hypothetical protein